MRDGFIRLGDPIAGGGKVIQASGFPSDGIPIALERDKGFCAVHGGEFEILGGNPLFIVNGRRSATEQLSKLACGCAMVSTARAFLARVSQTPPSRISDSGNTRPVAPPSYESLTKNGPANAFANPAHSGPCGPVRRFTADDITVIQSYNTMKQVATDLPASSNKPEELRALRQEAAAALNRSGHELEARSLCEHIRFLNKVNVYMSVQTVAGAKALVSLPPVFDLIINADPFGRLWDGHKVGVMLHELHHFTEENVQIRKGQMEAGKMMGPGSGYENNCFEFQARLGYPAYGYFDFSWDQPND